MLEFNFIHFKVCLDIQDKENQIDKWTEVYDLPQQAKIRDDCKNLIGKKTYTSDKT